MHASCLTRVSIIQKHISYTVEAAIQPQQSSKPSQCIHRGRSPGRHPMHCGLTTTTLSCWKLKYIYLTRCEELYCLFQQLQLTNTQLCLCPVVGPGCMISAAGSTTFRMLTTPADHTSHTYITHVQHTLAVILYPNAVNHNRVGQLSRLGRHTFTVQPEPIMLCSV
jgi:hypothetical protein